MKQSERVKAMKENLIDLRRKGISFAEIAKRYQLSVCTVYAYLEEIAIEAGTTREALLYQPHSKFTKNATTQPRKTCSVDPDEVSKDFNELLGSIDRILDKMKKVMEDE